MWTRLVKRHTLVTMAKRGRAEQLVSFIFLAIGALLLAYAGMTWYLAGRTPDVVRRVRAANSDDLGMAPALAPAVDDPGGIGVFREAGQEDGIVVAPPAAAAEAPAGPLVVLPESPIDMHSAVAEAAEADRPAAPGQPLRILIPALGIDAPVMAAGLQTKQSEGRDFQQWTVPDAYAAGWHESSAALGEPGNTVLNGHNNVHGAIFGELVDLAVGEQIVLFGAEKTVVYRVVHHELLPEKGLSLRERLNNARWIEASDDERLTLVTCWPNTTNSHRLIVVAMPIEDG
jgi:sortase A